MIIPDTVKIDTVLINNSITDNEEKFFTMMESSRTVRRKHRQKVTNDISEQTTFHKPFSDMKCKRCKQQDCLSYSYVQSRSMDEGQSTRFTCKLCGISWKTSS